MKFEMDKTPPRQIYNLLIGLVAPRPIALVTSMDQNGVLNAAPFSSYNYLCTDPPIVAIGVGNRPGPSVVGKDTAQNIRNTREFVINVVDEALADRAKESPAGRVGDPEEFGAACAFLCAASSGFIVGQNLLLDVGAFNSTMG